MYYLNVDLLDFTNNSSLPEIYRKDLIPSYDVQFTNSNGTFNTEFLGVNKTLEEVLDFYNSIYTNMQCFSYEWRID